MYLPFLSSQSSIVPSWLKSSLAIAFLQFIFSVSTPLINQYPFTQSASRKWWQQCHFSTKGYHCFSNSLFFIYGKTEFDMFQVWKLLVQKPKEDFCVGHVLQFQFIRPDFFRYHSEGFDLNHKLLYFRLKFNQNPLPSPD
jgi:hypothetical protein